MLLSAARTFNLVQARWSNLGVNLWEVTLRSITLTQGVTTYTVPANTIAILPNSYVRQFSLPTTVDQAAAFQTITGSNQVQVTIPGNGLSVGSYINLTVPVSISNLYLYGYYQVTNILTPDVFIITSPITASSTESPGFIPTVQTAMSSSLVSISANNQPYSAGDVFNFQVPMTIGGLTLSGEYVVYSASAGQFYIFSPTAATSGATGQMNSGLSEIQYGPIPPTDRVLYPMSRADYSALAIKTQQGQPTSFWFDRQTIPTVSFWPTADGNGPYIFQYYALTQMQDASVQNGALVDIPYRFMEAYAAACAAHLAMKWRQDLAPALEAYARQVWQEAADADREVVSMYLSPSFDGYFN
jgi:hypothetical protein